MDFKELISDFAERYGIEGLSANDNAAVIDVDGMTVGLIHDPASVDDTDDGIMVVVELGYPPPDADGPLGEVMLKANYLLGGTNGAILCQNPDTDAYAVMRRYSLSAHDCASFAAALEKLLITAENWKSVIAGIREADIAKEEQDMEEQDDTPPDSGFPANGFLQV